MAGASILLLTFVMFLEAGCLPLLVEEARTQAPGEISLAVGGLGRTTAMTPGISQVGPVAGVLELRGGLPPDRLDAGLTIMAPWNVTSDLKVEAVKETAWTPALAAQGQLGIFQPSYGGRVLASKSAGPFRLSVMAGRGVSSERLWPAGGDPFGDTAELFIKAVDEAGASLAWRISPVHDLLLSAVRWDVSDEAETVKLTGAGPLGAVEGRTWFFAAALRVHWSPAPPKPTSATLTALRGYVMDRPAPNRLVVGQPGIYKATVLLDALTVITADGKPADRDRLEVGGAVLIQGLSLPQPSTFLARTIELQ